MTDDARWNVVLTRQAEKATQRLSRTLLRRIDLVLEELARNPTPSGCKRLVGYSNLYRVRVGNWRIVYVVEKARLVVLVVKIAPRGEVYKNL